MYNSLRSLLFTVLLAMAVWPSASRAAPGYVSLHVPDVTQATRFFHDVLNCDVIAQAAEDDAASSAMLDCGDGITVEVLGGGNTPTRKLGITFATDNAAAAAAWLRSKHVAVGPLIRSAEGIDSEKVTVDFVTPWGQSMQLVSHGRPDDGANGTRLAAQ